MKLISSIPQLRRRPSWPRGGFARLPEGSLEKWRDLVQDNWQKLALLGLFGLGLFLGARLAGHAEGGWPEQILRLLDQQRQARAAQSFLPNALNYFASELLFLAAAYLCGLCAVGLPMVLSLPVIRGLGVGMLSGWLYQTYALSGLSYCILVLYPATVISMLIMLTYCKESMLMSGDMLLTVTGKQDRVESTVRHYTRRYLLLLLLSGGSAMVDALCFTAFAKLFSF
ncbi:MAG: stage II sporulation protein M [Oscillospiraceae bacterium]|nr:stage II sporulation protein M [Oscillospiraceae bacterium]